PVRGTHPLGGASSKEGGSNEYGSTASGRRPPTLPPAVRDGQRGAPVRLPLGGLRFRPARRPRPALARGDRPRPGTRHHRGLAPRGRPGSGPRQPRREEVLPPAAEEERLRPRTAPFAPDRPHDARTRGAETDRPRLRHPAPQPPLSRLLPDTVGT